MRVEIVKTGESGPPPFEPVVAMIDYTNVSWTGSAVTDANGDPVPGFAITSESGTHYPSSVPEPEAELLQLASAGLLAVRKLRGGASANPTTTRRTSP
jgi:hypothetical protein